MVECLSTRKFNNQDLAYKEIKNLELPKMFANIRGKGAMVSKFLSEYMSLIGLGLNSKLTYAR